MELPCYVQTVVFLVPESGQDSDTWAVISEGAPLCSLERVGHREFSWKKAFGEILSFLFQMQMYQKYCLRFHRSPAQLCPKTQPVTVTIYKLLQELWVTSLLAFRTLWCHYEVHSSPINERITQVETLSTSWGLQYLTPWPLSLSSL